MSHLHPSPPTIRLSKADPLSGVDTTDYQMAAQKSLLASALGGSLSQQLLGGVLKYPAASSAALLGSGLPHTALFGADQLPSLLTTAGISLLHRQANDTLSGLGALATPPPTDRFTLRALEELQAPPGGIPSTSQHQSPMLTSAVQSPKKGSETIPVINPAGLQLNHDRTLKALGRSMRKKDSPYIDASSLEDPHPTDLARRRTRGGVTEPFPEKLHRMLEEVEAEGKSDVISFFSHGRAFGVHDPDRFVKEVMPKYFKQSRMSSFQRQLNLYGFTRIGAGPDSGGYYHELFLKGRTALSIHMRRVGVPQGEDRRKLRTGVKKHEPDFYTMHKMDVQHPVDSSVQQGMTDYV